MSSEPMTIVAVEDEESDRLILDLAFQRAKLPHRLVILRNGMECVQYLTGLSHELPSVLLLDLKMPVMDGFELLGWLAQHPQLNHLPAVVLSSSSDDSDIRRARELGARNYFVKPLRLADLIAILQDLGAQYLSA